MSWDLDDDCYCRACGSSDGECGGCLRATLQSPETTDRAAQAIFHNAGHVGWHTAEPWRKEIYRKEASLVVKAILELP